MRISHVIGACSALGLALLVTAAGCGSSTSRSTYGDGDGSDGGSSSGSSGLGGFGDSGNPQACVGLQCQQKACGGALQTTLSGTVYAPNGTLPLYNAIVYVPNSTPDPITHGATCDQCGAVTGSPVVSTITNADGTFTLKNVPSGANIPLVIQVGKWRRQVVIPQINDCTDNQVSTPELTRLPKNQTEGDIPHIAFTTGAYDKLGCMLPKVGIDASEFGLEADGATKSIHVYRGDDEGGLPTVNGGPGAQQSAKAFWSDAMKLKTYDMVLLSCEGEEARDNSTISELGPSKSAASFQAMADYLTAGGRIFTSDFMYTWYKYSSDTGIAGAAQIVGGAPIGQTEMTINTTFPKGQALGDWLNVVKPGSNDKISPDVTFANVTSVSSTAQQWATSAAGSGFGSGGAGPRVFTVNVPTTAPAAMQCGRGVHLDAHLNNNGSDVIDSTFPAGCGTTLTDGEKLLAFFFFDLASCIQPDSSAPVPPVVN